jgi:aspartate-semialdehyde dehydrogenase
MREYKIAILGATGMVGQEFGNLLEERNFPMSSITLLASERSAGKKVYVAHREIEVKEAVPESFKDINIVFFSVSAELSRYFSPMAIQAGAVIVDDSSAFQMVVALNPLHKVNPIKRLVISTYQSVSGTGAAAMEELTVQTKEVLDGKAPVPHVYPHQIAFNVLPEIDVFLDNGYTKEEWKMVEETRKIMHAPDIAISATCARVPVFIGHSEAVSIEFSQPMTADEARHILAQSPGVKVLDDPAVSLYPQAVAAAGTDEVFVGRIRQDVSHPNGLVIWVVSDNLRKGASLNAVQIAETMIEKEWLSPRRQRNEETGTIAYSDGNTLR